MLWQHALFVALLVGTELVFTALSILNRRHGERTARRERDWVAETLGIEDLDRVLEYHRIKTGFGLLETWVGLGVLLGVLYSGLFAEAVARVESLGLGPVATGVAFFLGAVVAVRLLSLPFDAVDTFAVEEAFGFNRQSPVLWVRDQLLQLAISLVLVGVVGAAVLWLVAGFEWWWVGAWALLVAFSLGMLVIYPRVIAPLFYDFEPIEGGLREAVDDTFERAGFECEQVYEMDASRRSSKSNAYFVGFGRTKRVVLFDTLIEGMDRASIQAVLAHELAHWKKAHVWKRLAAGALQTGVVLFALQWLIGQAWLYEMFGVPETAYAGLALGVLWIRPLNRFTAPLSNKLSLKHEREADAFAVEVMGDGEPMVRALADLASDNFANPFPHPWYAAFHYDHPPIPERIRFIREQARSQGQEDGDPPETPGGSVGSGDPA